MIRIIDNYYFTADSGNYTLFECGQREKIDRKTRKSTGEISNYQDTLGYFSSLSAMLEKCLSVASAKKANELECYELSEYISIMKEIYGEIKNSVAFSEFSEVIER